MTAKMAASEFSNFQDLPKYYQNIIRIISISQLQLEF